MNCCCKRKNNSSEMVDIHRENIITSYDDRLSNIYELVMSPCDNDNFLPETPPSIQKTIINNSKKTNVYVNFFENDYTHPTTPISPKTPILIQEDCGTIHVKIPRDSELYINYEKFNNILN
jgi:hypothetical protein